VLPSGEVMGRSLLRQVRGSGRLTRLLRTGAGAPVTWLLDPDLVQSVTVLAEDTNQDAAGDATGDTSSDDASGASARAAAAAWLTLLGESVSAEDDVRATAYAQPDPDLMLAGGLTADEAASALSPALRDTAPVTRRTNAEVSTLVYPQGGWVSPAGVVPLIDAGARQLLLMADAVVTTDGRQGTSLRSSGRIAGEQSSTPAVTLADPGLSSVLAEGTPNVRRALDVRQRLLAETFMAGTASRTPPLVIVPPHGWRAPEPVMSAVVETIQSAEWIEPIQLRDIPQRRVRLIPGTQPTVAVPPLEPADVPREAVDLQDDAEAVADLLSDPVQAQTSFRRSEHRALSTTFREQPDRGRAYTDALASGLSGAEALVGVVAPTSVTLSSRTGQFPITVVNDLSADIDVQLRLAAANTDRLTVVDPQPETVGAGQRQTLRVTAQAAGNGAVPVTVRLETVSGKPVGTPVRTVVVATDYGLVGWAIVASGALLLGVMVLRRVRLGKG
jgi:hypothetical protein